ncbi:DEAD/DEAH box helicase [Micavibrio aeruginosavorus]|uniref:DEAD/DEAH box helicase n=1 Tax=Micavibrio aeruginosavorus TaxID=349221 RepID=UPI003F4A87B0
MQNFHEMGLPDALVRALDYMKFETPTPIQAQAIPIALAGNDILGSAQTGTGKTGAFAIPIIAKLIEFPESGALIMTPTRELAVQVADIVRKMLGSQPTMTLAVLIGGEPMDKQMRQLRTHPRIIIGTPGRINDHLQRGTVNFEKSNFLVLDETDRMLDMGFGIQIEKIIRTMPKERQTMMFSATIPPYIGKLSAQYLKNPQRISIGEESTAAPKIKQELIHTNHSEKYGALIGQLDQREGSVIIFVKTKHGADRLAHKLTQDDFRSEALHGDLRQNKRDRVIRSFRDKKYRILVATDVAARGLDIPHIEHVVNYDLPQCAEDYIHRIGRTGRAGAEGNALCLLTSEDGGKWKAIHKLMNPPANGEKHEARDENGGRPSFGRRSGGGFKQGGFKRDGYRKEEGGRDGYKKEGFKPRRDFDDRPRQDRPRSERPFGDRPRGDRPFNNDRPREDRPRRDFNDRPSFRDDRGGDRPFQKRDDDRGNRFNRDERPSSPWKKDRPYNDRPQTSAPRGDKPFGDRPFNDRPRRDFADRPKNNERGDRPFNDRPRDDRPREDRPRREFSDRPRQDAAPRRNDDSFGNSQPKFQGDRDGNRPERGNRDADGNRRDFAKRDGDRPFGRRPSGNGGKPAGRPMGGQRPAEDGKVRTASSSGKRYYSA